MDTPVLIVARFKLICLLCAVLILAACGFHPRGETTLPFSAIYLSGPETSSVLNEIRRLSRSKGQIRLVEKRDDAPLMLQILADERDRTILSLSGGGKVREYQLRHRVLFRIAQSKDQDSTPPSEIVITRVLSHSDTEILAKEKEADLLYREMQADAIAQIMRRLAAVKS